MEFLEKQENIGKNCFSGRKLQRKKQKQLSENLSFRLFSCYFSLLFF